MDGPSVAAEVSAADWAVLQRAVRRRSPGNANWANAYRWVNTATVVAAVVLALDYPPAWLLVGLLAAQIAVLVVGQRNSRLPPPLATATYRVDGDGLRRIAEGTESLVRWPAISDVVSSEQHDLVLFAETGWVLPARCFATPQHRADFFAAVAKHRLHG